MCDVSSDSSASHTAGNGKRGRKRSRPHLTRILSKEIPLPISIEKKANLSSETNVSLPNGEVASICAHQLIKVDQIGKGCYGVVERMRDPNTQLEFAVKRMVAAIGESYKMDQQLREMNVSQRTSECPYTVLFYGAMVCEGEVYLLMELMDTNLSKLYRQVYQRGGVIPESVLRSIAYAVVSALYFMKEQLCIMHRDVKPSNILANRIGHFKVCDFGIAGNLVNSVARTHIGTQVYMAPERINPDTKGYTAKSDVWSLGVSLYELATGDCPFPCKAAYFKLMQIIVHSPSPRLSETGPDARFSSAFRDFVAKCLTKEEGKRPNFQELLQHEFLVNFNPDETRSECSEFLCLMLAGEESNEKVDGVMSPCDLLNC